jgi:hypothetical protein
VKISGSGLAIGAVTVNVYDHGKQICAATVQKSGGGWWTCTATLGIGTHSLTARQHDAFGNRSRPSQVVSLSVTAPTVPLAATGSPIGAQITPAVALVLACLIALRAGATRPRRRSSVNRESVASEVIMIGELADAAEQPRCVGRSDTGQRRQAHPDAMDEMAALIDDRG